MFGTNTVLEKYTRRRRFSITHLLSSVITSFSFTSVQEISEDLHKLFPFLEMCHMAGVLRNKPRPKSVKLDEGKIRLELP